MKEYWAKLVFKDPVHFKPEKTGKLTKPFSLNNFVSTTNIPETLPDGVKT